MKYIVPLLTSFITFLVPIEGLLVLVGSVVLLDTIFGCWASYKSGGWKSITSHKMFNLAVKTFFYMGAILLAFMADTFVCGGAVFGIAHGLSKAVSVLWLYIEVKSIDENSQKMGNRPVLDIIKEAVFKWKSIKNDINQ